MKNIIKKVLSLAAKHTMMRGMLSYGLTWTTGSLVEQTLVEHRTYRNYDWIKCLRYGLFGSLAMAPTMYIWVRIADIMWPKSDLRSALGKSLTEQVAIDPFCIAFFLYSMSRLEGKSHLEGELEVKAKYMDIYSIGIVYWPLVQTMNFMFVPLVNQVVVTSVFSLIWSTFLAYTKSTDGGREYKTHEDKKDRKDKK